MAPFNALCIVQSEIALLSTFIKCNTRIAFRINQDDPCSPLYKQFVELKLLLDNFVDLTEVEPLVYLTPFLDVIRCKETSGPITDLALTAVDKFLSYGILALPRVSNDRSPTTGVNSLKSIAIAAEAIANAVTQAGFVGTEASSDEVVLMKVLHLSRTLLLVPAGYLVSDLVVCKIFQNCFRICFEPRLSELLRRTAELCLCSMMQLFFSRLPTFIASLPATQHDSAAASLTPQSAVSSPPPNEDGSPVDKESQEDPADPAAVSRGALTSTELTPLSWRDSQEGECIPHRQEVDDQPSQDIEMASTAQMVDLEAQLDQRRQDSPMPVLDSVQAETPDAVTHDTDLLSDAEKGSFAVKSVNTGDRAGAGDDVPDPASAGQATTTTELAYCQVVVSEPRPYGLPAIYELLHYLADLLTPGDHKYGIISVSLSLVTIAVETGADAIAQCPSLLSLVQGDLTKNLLLLLGSVPLWLFATSLRVCFMLFQSMRRHLKLQMEVYLRRLIAICSPEEVTSYEHREIALESVVRLLLLPGLATELFINYDCDPYCTDLFKDVTKILARNACPTDHRLLGTHQLSLDALLSLLATIGPEVESDAAAAEASVGGGISATTDAPPNTTVLLPSQNRLNAGEPMESPLTVAVVVSGHSHHSDAGELPTKQMLEDQKTRKKILIQGSDQFNDKAERGIAYLQQHNILDRPLDPQQLTTFLLENPRLDKRMIGEFISSRGNDHILEAYVKRFNFTGVPIEDALRVYLETFRLPGEAPLIQRVMEHFAEHWFTSNRAPFENVDAAFTLAYAILMLNTDQHNPNSKKQNVPMKFEQFKRNLSGTNGTEDFDPQLLLEIFQSVQKNEIVMPSEQTGLVRENYRWKCLLRRAAAPSFRAYVHLETQKQRQNSAFLNADLFDLFWGPVVSALSFIFDRGPDASVQAKAVQGFVRCAAIAAYYDMSDVLDNLVIALCKFTTLTTCATELAATVPLSFGRSAKARLSLRLVFTLAASHANILRYGWHYLRDCILQLFRANLLPDDLRLADDFLSSSRRVRLVPCSRSGRGVGRGGGAVGLDNFIVPIEVPVAKTSLAGGQRRPADTVSRPRGVTSGGSQAESSVFSAFYQYLTIGSAWSVSGEEDGDDEESLEEDVESVPGGADADDEADGSFEAASAEQQRRRRLVDIPEEGRRRGLVSASASQLASQYPNWLVDFLTKPGGSYDSAASSGKGALQVDDQAAVRLAMETVKQCEIGHLLADSKFLVDASLMELIKALLRVICGDLYTPIELAGDTTDAVLGHLMPAYNEQNPPAVMYTCSADPVVSSAVASSGGGQTGSSRKTAAWEPDLGSAGGTRHSTGYPTTMMKVPSYYSPVVGVEGQHRSSGGPPLASPDCRCLCLELLIRVLLHNQDRISQLWPLVRFHLVELLMLTSMTTGPSSAGVGTASGLSTSSSLLDGHELVFNTPLSPASSACLVLLVERVVVGFLRLVSRLLRRRHQMASEILACLNYILFHRGDQLLADALLLQQQEQEQVEGHKRPGRHGGHVSSSRSSPQSSLGHLAPNRVGRQVIAGLSEVVHSSHAADLPEPATNWRLIFGLLDVCGAGLRASESLESSKDVHFTNTDRTCCGSSPDLQAASLSLKAVSPCGYTSDGELPFSPPQKHHHCQHFRHQLGHGKVEVGEKHCPKEWEQADSGETPATDNCWVIMETEAEQKRQVKEHSVCDAAATVSDGVDDLPSSPDLAKTADSDRLATTSTSNDGSGSGNHLFIASELIAYPVTIGLARDPVALEQAISSCLAFLVRDPAHISPENIEYCVQSLRVFVEACLRRRWCLPPVERGLNQSVSTGESRQQQLGNSRSRLPSYPGSGTASNSEPEDTGSVHYRHQQCQQRHQPHCQQGLQRRVQKALLLREEFLSPTTAAVTSELLDLIYIIFTRATSIYTEWTRLSYTSTTTSASAVRAPQSQLQSTGGAGATTVDLAMVWTTCWCPLLQAIARLCCDCRREVRSEALTYLQRALLWQKLADLSGPQWQACFNKILFPLLTSFLESIAEEETVRAAADALASNPDDLYATMIMSAPAVVNNSRHRATAGSSRRQTSIASQLHSAEFADPRMRAIPLLTKVFLQNLRPLTSSPDDFRALWTRILAYMQAYMQASSSDSLTDAVRESLKNVLLVLSTGTNDTPSLLSRDAPADSLNSQLWQVTARQLSSFLPNLLDEVFPPPFFPPPPTLSAETNGSTEDEAVRDDKFRPEEQSALASSELLATGQSGQPTGNSSTAGDGVPLPLRSASDYFTGDQTELPIGPKPELTATNTASSSIGVNNLRPIPLGKWTNSNSTYVVRDL